MTEDAREHRFTVTTVGLLRGVAEDHIVLLHDPVTHGRYKNEDGEPIESDEPKLQLIGLAGLQSAEIEVART